VKDDEDFVYSNLARSKATTRTHHKKWYSSRLSSFVVLYDTTKWQQWEGQISFNFFFIKQRLVNTAAACFGLQQVSLNDVTMPRQTVFLGEVNL